MDESTMNEEDFDLGDFLYKNDPDFRQKCNDEMEAFGLSLEEVLKAKEIEFREVERKSHNPLIQPTPAKKESVFDKFMSSMEKREEAAIEKFKRTNENDTSDETIFQIIHQQNIRLQNQKGGLMLKCMQNYQKKIRKNCRRII